LDRVEYKSQIDACRIRVRVQEDGDGKKGFLGGEQKSYEGKLGLLAEQS
jgi:hypothetical protein